MIKIVLLYAFLTLSVQANDIDKLLQSMNIEQKCGQMTQVTFDVIEKTPRPTDPDENPVNMTKLEYAIKTKNVVIYGLDSIHGGNYIRESVLFPQPISMAGSFNLEIAKKVGEITSLETRATGIPWNFNPVLDVGRQPLWPRIFETYGEDPYLAGKMGENYIHGSQGNDLKNRTKLATCLKHYIGYSLPFNGRDRTPALIPENLLREVFLPPFEKGVLAGSPTVMVNSGEVNGMPGHANYHYLTE
ncbi:unnamed protein product, partial [Brachionus calyciflorus]